MSDQHTPGPWKVLKAGNQWGIVKAKAKRGEDDICGGSVFHDDWEANAKLIAAAPDLAEAAREIDRLSLVILSAVNHADKAHVEGVSGALKALRTAVAKAGADQ